MSKSSNFHLLVFIYTHFSLAKVHSGSCFKYYLYVDNAMFSMLCQIWLKNPNFIVSAKPPLSVFSVGCSPFAQDRNPLIFDLPLWCHFSYSIFNSLVNFVDFAFIIYLVLDHFSDSQLQFLSTTNNSWLICCSVPVIVLSFFPSPFLIQ
jgi:hypothetical protein